MSKKICLVLLISLSFNSLIAQAMCVPNNLYASHGNRSVSLSWAHVNDESGDNLIFLECFPYIPFGCCLVRYMISSKIMNFFSKSNDFIKKS